MNLELKRNLRSRWFFSLFEFGYLNFQERLWVKADYPGIMGNHTEAICKYFDDLNLDNGYSDYIRQGVISQTEFEIISEYHNKLNIYVGRTEKQGLSDKEILMDPEWINLSLIANENWNKMKRIISNKEEIHFMDTLEATYLRN